MAIRKSPALPVITAILALLLLAAFTVISIGVLTDKTSGENVADRFINHDENSEEQQLEHKVQEPNPEVIPKEIHYFESLERIHSMEARGQDFYIVVFDAGTSGTRAHVLHFGQPSDGKLYYIVNKQRNFVLSLAQYVTNLLIG